LSTTGSPRNRQPRPRANYRHPSRDSNPPQSSASHRATGEPRRYLTHGTPGCSVDLRIPNEQPPRPRSARTLAHAVDHGHAAHDPEHLQDAKPHAPVGASAALVLACQITEHGHTDTGRVPIG